jgi:hypothetical protein
VWGKPRDKTNERVIKGIANGVIKLQQATRWLKGNVAGGLVCRRSNERSAKYVNYKTEILLRETDAN